MDSPGELNTATRSAATVLVADDDETSLRALRLLLTREGHDVIEALNGETALQLARDKRPDVLVLDVVMPGMDGIEVCDRVRKVSGLELLPILLITAYEDHESRVRGLQAGANDFIMKPVNPDELGLKIQNLLRAAAVYRDLKRSHEEISRLEALKGALMHMVVHDMRAPLMVVKGYLDLLAEDSDGLLNEEYTEYVGEAVSETSTLVRIINMLYDIAALESGSAELSIEKRDIVAVTERALESLGPMYGQAPVSWRRPPEPLVAECDARFVERVMANLVSRALRCTPEDCVVNIEMGTCETGLRVAVSDMGPTVPEEQRSAIFDKFGQAAAWGERRRHGGGLGLAFCRLAVEAHGGMIGMSLNEKGGPGNTVWLVLPVDSPHTRFLRESKDEAP